MDGIGDHGNQLQAKELFKLQFSQDFARRLDELLGFDEPEPVIFGGQVLWILLNLTKMSVEYGRECIAEDEPEYDGGAAIGPLIRISQQRSYMQLLRESDPNTNEGRALLHIQDQATLVGRKVSKFLVHMMVVTNIENRSHMMKHFSDTLMMFPFFMDAFEWAGRGDDLVVYNRINMIMKYAHKEFILQVKTARMEGPRIGYIQSLGINFNSKNNRDELLDIIFTQILRVISILEFLLSFPLLPDMPRLLITETRSRSVAWLEATIVNLEEWSNQRIRFLVRALMSEYERHQNYKDVDAFLSRVHSPTSDLWDDLGRVEEVRASRSLGRVRLYVRASIILLNGNRALIQIKGINSRHEAEWYIGKRIAYFYRVNVRRKYRSIREQRIAYFYRANVRRKVCKYSCIWGEITMPHEYHVGVLHAWFRSLLPMELFDNRDDTNRRVRKGLRVYMYRPRLEKLPARLFIGLGD